MRPPSAAAEGRLLCDGSTKLFPGIGFGGGFDPPPSRGRDLPVPLAATPPTAAAPPVTGALVAAECNLHVAPGGVDHAVLQRGSLAARLLPLALLALLGAPPLIPAPLPVCWLLPWRLWPPLLRGLWRLVAEGSDRVRDVDGGAALPSLLQRRRPWRWALRGRLPPWG